MISCLLLFKEKKLLIDSTWRQAFKNALGESIINNSMGLYWVRCETANLNEQITTSGNKIIDKCWKYVQNVDVARIDLIKYPFESNNVFFLG